MLYKKNVLFAPIIAAVVLILTVTSVQGETIYVNASATGANTGETWEDAFTSLQDGLDTAGSGDDICVAQGHYRPASPAGDRAATFQLINGVAFYGGYAGFGAPNPNERGPNAYETILSGDLLDNDNPEIHVENLHEDSCREDNCYYVFYNPTGTNLNTTVMLDGLFTFTGNADIEYPNYCGGEMYNYFQH